VLRLLLDHAAQHLRVVHRLARNRTHQVPKLQQQQQQQQGERQQGLQSVCVIQLAASSSICVPCNGTHQVPKVQHSSSSRNGGQHVLRSRRQAARLNSAMCKALGVTLLLLLLSPWCSWHIPFCGYLHPFKHHYAAPSGHEYK
jgi:hypothetical protein